MRLGDGQMQARDAIHGHIDQIALGFEIVGDVRRQILAVFNSEYGNRF